MRFLLDTNVISSVIKPEPPPALLEWMAARDDSELFIASLTIGEIRRGILQMPTGKRRDALATWFDGPEGPLALFAGRILSFDAKTALAWAELMAAGVKSGRPRSALDTVIAAIAFANDCIVATDNGRDFPGVEVVNPLRAGAT